MALSSAKLNGSHDNYLKAALSGEIERVVKAPKGDRNNALFRAAAALGELIGGGHLDEHEARQALERAAAGYIQTDGVASARSTIDSGIQAGKQQPRSIPANDNQREPARSRSDSQCDHVAATPQQAGTAPTSFPSWTQPDGDGKPRFHPWGEEGPPRQPNELRRHLCAAAGVSVRVKIKYQNGEHAAYVNWYRVVDPNGVIGWQAKKPAGYVAVPYTGGIDLFDPAISPDRIYWPEGEKDVDTITNVYGLALTFGGTDGLPEGCEQFVAGRHVVILGDNDEPGRKHAEKKAALCATVAASVKVVDFPELPVGGDVSDWFAADHTVYDLLDRVEAAPLWRPPSSDSAQGTALGLIARRASEIVPESVEWMWPFRIAIGKLSLLAGDPGLGKSQLTAFMAGVVTTGGDWPCCDEPAQIGDVIVLSAEDDVSDTIIPRLLALGANLDRVLVVEAVTTDEGRGRRMFHLENDIERLEKLLDEHPETRLIIIDPVTAYMGGIDTHRNSDVRGVLALLGEMAARRRVAVVCVSHLNKNIAGSAINRVTGSGAFVAAVRAAFLVAKDPGDDSRRLFVPSKNNLAKDTGGLAYRIAPCSVGDDGSIQTSRVEWENEPIKVTADEALGAGTNSPEKTTVTDDAVGFLETALANGPVEVTELEAEARAAGLLKASQPLSQCKPLRDARARLGVTSQRSGFGKNAKYHWRLSDSTMDDLQAMDVPF